MDVGLPQDMTRIYVVGVVSKASPEGFVSPKGYRQPIDDFERFLDVSDGSASTAEEVLGLSMTGLRALEMAIVS